MRCPQKQKNQLLFSPAQSCYRAVLQPPTSSSTLHARMKKGVKRNRLQTSPDVLDLLPTSSPPLPRRVNRSEKKTDYHLCATCWNCSPTVFLHFLSKCQQKRNKNHLLSTCWVLLSPTSHVVSRLGSKKSIDDCARVTDAKKTFQRTRVQNNTHTVSFFLLDSMAEKTLEDCAQLPSAGDAYSEEKALDTHLVCHALAVGSPNPPPSFSISPILGPPLLRQKHRRFQHFLARRAFAPHFMTSIQS